MNRWEILRRRMLRRAAGRAILRLLSWAYGAAVAIRRLLYRIRLLPSRRLSAKTICIGNLTTGGTGKTSAVLLAADTLRRRQVKVAILSRGYRRPRQSGDVQVLLNSQNVSWQGVGDEPWMMHQALKGLEVPILVSPDRYRAGVEALHYYDSQALVLDDGYQHFKLRRDLDILLVDAVDPFGGGDLLPLGNLREPLSAAGRARVIVLTHCDQVRAERLEEIRRSLAGVNPGAAVLESVHRPSFLLDLKTERKRRLTYFKGKTLAAFSAIGNPSSFERLLAAVGGHVIQAWRYPDHHLFTPPEIRSIEAARGGATVVTTFKDIPRLPTNWQEILAGEVFALGIRLEITEGKDIWEAELCRGLATA